MSSSIWPQLKAIPYYIACTRNWHTFLIHCTLMFTGLNDCNIAMTCDHFSMCEMGRNSLLLNFLFFLLLTHLKIEIISAICIIQLSLKKKPEQSSDLKVQENSSTLWFLINMLKMNMKLDITLRFSFWWCSSPLKNYTQFHHMKVNVNSAFKPCPFMEERSPLTTNRYTE